MKANRFLFDRNFAAIDVTPEPEDVEEPASETTENEVEAGEVDCEAEQGGDGEPDVAQGADGTGSEVARLLGPPLVLGAPEPELEGGVGCGALA